MGVFAVGCEGAVGAVGLWEQAPTTEATDTSMANRNTRDIVGSSYREPHRYDLHHTPTDIAGDIIICGGAR